MRSKTTNVNSGRWAVKLTALAICVVFVLVFVLSSAYVVTNANHRHDHNGKNGACAVCVNIALCEKLLGFLGTAMTLAAITVSIAIAATQMSVNAPLHKPISLIGLKVRMNS